MDFFHRFDVLQNTNVRKALIAIEIATAIALLCFADPENDNIGNVFRTGFCFFVTAGTCVFSHFTLDNKTFPWPRESLWFLLTSFLNQCTYTIASFIYFIEDLAFSGTWRQTFFTTMLILQCTLIPLFFLLAMTAYTHQKHQKRNEDDERFRKKQRVAFQRLFYTVCVLEFATLCTPFWLFFTYYNEIHLYAWPLWGFTACTSMLYFHQMSFKYVQHDWLKFACIMFTSYLTSIVFSFSCTWDVINTDCWVNTVHSIISFIQCGMLPLYCIWIYANFKMRKNHIYSLRYILLSIFYK